MSPAPDDAMNAFDPPPPAWPISRRAVLGGLAAASLAPIVRAEPAPAAGFVALGDWGRYGDAPQRAVAGAMAEAAAEISSRFVLAAGDNFYPAGVASTRDRHWRESFEEVYTARSLQTPWYPALGNHDYRGVPRAQIRYSRVSRRWRMPRRYHRVTAHDHGVPGLDLFVIDTAALVQPPNEGFEQLRRGRFWIRRRDTQLAWLEAALTRSHAPWKIVLGHHPIHSGAHGDERVLVEELKPVLERHGVQVYLNGHDHNLQHIRRGPVSYVCSGAGSDARRVKAVEGTEYCVRGLGFAMFVLRGDRLELEFRDDAGRTLYQGEIAQSVA